MKTWRLKNPKQCHKCPWKISTNCYQIPDGYTEEAHLALKQTIADDIPIEEQLQALGTDQSLKIMACHESSDEERYHCIGWIVNQMGPGNNLRLRFSMMNCENANEVETFGEQHSCFEDTLP